jgi:aspartate/methionine/tyrosine aminotransferase
MHLYSGSTTDFMADATRNLIAAKLAAAFQDYFRYPASPGIDMKHMQWRRDRIVDALRELGYELHVPEATFYLFSHSPIPDDLQFCDWLAEEGIIAMPGEFLDLRGYFRLSLTATDEMIERSLPGFAKVMAGANA